MAEASTVPPPGTPDELMPAPESGDVKPLLKFSRAMHNAGPDEYVVWQVCTRDWSDGLSGLGWTDYNPDYAEQFERLLETGGISLRYKPGERYEYEVNVQNMMQTNLRTGKVRGIRRFVISRADVSHIVRAVTKADETNTQVWERWKARQAAKEAETEEEPEPPITEPNPKKAKTEE